jgi:predicted ribosome-associated RNA-binding protein Tma20
MTGRTEQSEVKKSVQRSEERKEMSKAHEEMLKYEEKAFVYIMEGSTCVWKWKISRRIRRIVTSVKQVPPLWLASIPYAGH